jgi:hypothetical protein
MALIRIDCHPQTTLMRPVLWDDGVMRVDIRLAPFRAELTLDVLGASAHLAVSCFESEGGFVLAPGATSTSGLTMTATDQTCAKPLGFASQKLAR